MPSARRETRPSRRARSSATGSMTAVRLLDGSGCRRSESAPARTNGCRPGGPRGRGHQQKSWVQRSFGSRGRARRRCFFCTCDCRRRWSSTGRGSGPARDVRRQFPDVVDRQRRTVEQMEGDLAEAVTQIGVGELEHVAADATSPLRWPRRCCAVRAQRASSFGRQLAEVAAESGVVPGGGRAPRELLRQIGQVVASSIVWSISLTKAVPRSKLSVTMATRQPSFSLPTRFATGTRTSSKNTSQNSVLPSMVRSGRTSIPGRRMGTISHVMPGAWGRRRRCGRASLSSRRRGRSSSRSSDR